MCDKRLERRLRQINVVKKNKAAANALLSLRKRLDMDGAEHLSGYDRTRVCVPQICDCRQNDCRYLAFLRECEARRYAFQICNHNLLIADAIRREEGGKPILRASCAVMIDEAHKLPEAARQMFGDTLEGKELRALVRALRAERYPLAADVLSDNVRNLLESLDTPRQDRPFSEYERLLIAPDRILATIGKQLQDELSAPARRRLGDVTKTVSALCEKREGMVRYTGKSKDGYAMLCVTVADLDKHLDQTLWHQPQPFVLSSGTLAVGSDFRRFREETGLSKYFRVRESVSLSPFDYQKNCLLYLPGRPLRIRKKDYYDRLATEIKILLNASCGHALVLFTSYAAMSAIKELLKEKKLRWRIYTMNRNAVYTVSQFRDHPGSVLLATGAAWEGIDFPGDSVSMLIIPRLPFPRPDALKERERERYETLRDYIQNAVVPEMQIKLRQGFGRAIRTETDTCVVAILDERAGIHGTYHEDVLSALPDMHQTGSVKDVRQFIRSVKPDKYFTEGNQEYGTKREC